MVIVPKCFSETWEEIEESYERTGKRGEEFRRKQNSIYETISKLGENARINGIRPSPHVADSGGGIFVIVKHPPQIALQVQSFSRKIAGLVPAIVYEENYVHTCVGTCIRKPHFTFMPLVHAKSMEDLKSIVREVAFRMFLKPKCAINYPRYIHSDEGVIAAGEPNDYFVKLCDDLREAALARGIDLELPWGAHMTASRFTTHIPPTQQEKLAPLFDLVEGTSGPGLSFPESIHVVCSQSQQNIGDEHPKRSRFFMEFGAFWL